MQATETSPNVSRIEPSNLSIGQLLTQLIAEQTGLNMRGQEETIYVKIIQRMQALELTSPLLYHQLLQSQTAEGEQEWQKLIALLTNPESYFFRDKEQFSLLKKQIFPELIRRRRGSRTLRICSAGCSTGEELYSLAILLTELLPDFEQWNLMILGLDINLESIEKARRGIYRSWSFRGVDSAIQKQYFLCSDNTYQIIPAIQHLTRFQTLNLAQPSPTWSDLNFKDMDLILCRNVFIYLENSAIASILDRFYQALNPLGYLLTGHAELYAQDLTQFQVKVFPESLIYQRPVESVIHESVVNESVVNESVIHKSAVSQSQSGDRRTNSRLNEDKAIDLNFIPTADELEANHLEADHTVNHCQIINHKTNTPYPHPNPSIQQESDLKKAHDSTLNDSTKPSSDAPPLDESIFRKEAYQLVTEQINQALKLSPHNASIIYRMAQAQANFKQYEEAKSYCYQSLKMDAFFIPSYYLLASIARTQGQITEAKRILKKVIFLDPYSIAAYFKLSEIYQQEGDKARMYKMQCTALEILCKLPPDRQIPELNYLTVAQLIQTLNTNLQSC